MAGHFSVVHFVATGGINESNAAYLTAPNCIAICDSYIVARDAVAAGDWERITENARRAMGAIS